MPGRDIAVAVVVLGFSALVFHEAWNMPIFSGQALTAPGLFPMITAVAMGALALGVLVTRMPQVLGWVSSPPPAAEEPLGSVGKVMLCLAVVGLAIFVMRPAGFIAAGVVATAGLMLVGLGRRPSWREGALIVALSAGLPVGTHWLFTQVFLTPLP